MTVCVIDRLEIIKIYKYGIVLFVRHLCRLIFQITNEITSVSDLCERICVHCLRKLFTHATQFPRLLLILNYYHCHCNKYCKKSYYKRYQCVNTQAVRSNIELRTSMAYYESRDINNEYRCSHYDPVT